MSGTGGGRCPKCGQNEKLYVVGLAWFTVTGDLETEYTGKPDGDIEWDSDAVTRCPSCGHEGKWGEFCRDDEEESN
jgi:hypothetical protein